MSNFRTFLVCFKTILITQRICTEWLSICSIACTNVSSWIKQVSVGFGEIETRNKLQGIPDQRSEGTAVHSPFSRNIIISIWTEAIRRCYLIYIYRMCSLTWGSIIKGNYKIVFSLVFLLMFVTFLFLLSWFSTRKIALVFFYFWFKWKIVKTFTAI